MVITLLVTGPDRSGSVFDGRYLLEKLIGRGASAEVYRAKDQRSNEDVAVKIITVGLDKGPEAKARFEREAAVQAMIRHRNVAALLGSGVTAKQEPYLVLELLRGKSLRTMIKTGGAMSALRGASYAWQALQGLAAVHEQNVLHRDLKPANIMLEPSPGPVDRVVLIDFGFAALEGGAALTLQGSIVGSLTYIAPERLRAEGADQRSDLYAIGAILFELVTGRPPFEAEGDLDLIELHMHAPTPVTMSQGSVSPLDGIIQRSLQKDPNDRFSSALDMANALGQIASTLAG
jgi:eukaryotic-like serine/threonine-protein kinase